MSREHGQMPAPHPTQLPPRPAGPSAPPPPATGRRTSMVKVKIDTPGATIELEAEGDLDTVSAEALRLFNAAGGWPQIRTLTTGFGSGQERRHTYDAHEPINTGGGR